MQLKFYIMSLRTQRVRIYFRAVDDVIDVFFPVTVSLSSINLKLYNSFY